MVDKSLDDLHPDLKPLARKFLEECDSEALNVRITETWRDPAREDSLHAQGITAATGQTCKHCFEIDGKPASKAFDFICLDENDTIIADGTNADYTMCGQILKDIGLKWGGDFKHKDYDHAELIED